jgi:DNA-binding FadR family transcriptional regulator
VLTVKHGVGATIAPRAAWNLFDAVLLDAMLAGPEAGAALAEVQECRRILWPETAAAAARSRTEEQLDALEAAGEEAAFADALLAAAGNRFLAHVLLALERAAPAPARDQGDGGRGAVVEAVAAGDPAAAHAAMLRRLDRG